MSDVFVELNTGMLCHSKVTPVFFLLVAPRIDWSCLQSHRESSGREDISLPAYTRG